jgi:hypothetical protein
MFLFWCILIMVGKLAAMKIYQHLFFKNIPIDRERMRLLACKKALFLTSMGQETYMQSLFTPPPTLFVTLSE